MRVLVINPQTEWITFDGHAGAGTRDFGDHLGLRYIAAIARARGHDVALIDAHFHHLTSAAVKERIRRLVGEAPFDVVGVTGIEHTIPLVLEVLDECRRLVPDAHLCVGGYAATFWWRELIERAPVIDTVICGEGELTFGALLDRLSAQREWRDLAGLAFRGPDGRAINNPARELCDLNELPPPLRDERYPRGYANILSSRGCYGACTFCSIIRFYGSAPGVQVRVRDPNAVSAEIADLEARGVRHIDFVDDNFVSGAKTSGWVEEFCVGLTKLDRRITFGLQMRPDDVDEAMLTQLRRVGLKIVSIGVENDRESRLKQLGKHTTKEINRRSLDILDRLGLTVYVEMLLFHPTSDLGEIRENIRFMEQIRYWQYTRVTPATFLHELQLYRGLPLLKHYERLGLTRLKPDGFGYSYEYADPKVPRLLACLGRWRRHANHVTNHHLAYYHYALAARGQVGPALRSLRLSQRYLKFDLEVFSSLLDSVEQGASDEAMDAWMAAKSAELRTFAQGFEALSSSVPERIAYSPGG